LPHNVVSATFATSASVRHTHTPKSQLTVQGIETLFVHTIERGTSFVALNFVVLNCGVHPNECVKYRHSLSTAKIWPTICATLETVQD